MPLPSHPKDSDAFYKASVHVPEHVIVYFERMVLGRGWQQNIFADLILKFHAECVRRGLSPQWEPDNTTKLSLILSELTFSSNEKSTPVKKKNVRPKSTAD